MDDAPLDAVRIAALETIRHPAHPNLLHVRLTTEDGVSGLGETFYDRDAVERVVHELFAPALIGAAAGAEPSIPVPSGEMRSPEWSARSALDLALHDLRARLAGRRLCDLLGGGVLRDAAPVYVTCIDPHHPGEDWGLGVPAGSAHRDWTAALERPAELGRELAEQGFRGAKLFPFARLETETGGESIDAAMLEENVELFRAMRSAAGSEFALFCDLAGGWQLEPAVTIARALEPIGLTWLEDPLPPEELGDLERLASATSVRLAGHETRAGVESFRRLLRTGAISVVHLDVQWCGGLTEAARIGALAAASGLRVAFHDCAGPVAWACSLHASLALENASWLECARPYALDAYPAIADGLPELSRGSAHPGSAPGHGVALKQEWVEQASVRSSAP